MKFFALVAVAAARHHHHHHDQALIQSEASYEAMNEDELLVNLESTLNTALSSEARGDGDAAVAKTAAIKNIQKALTARILKRLDDGQPLVEVARKMKAIRACSPRSTIWSAASVSCSPSSPSSRTPSRTSRRPSMSAAWARSEHSRVSLTP